jgi:hypothetical protein
MTVAASAVMVLAKIFKQEIDFGEKAGRDFHRGRSRREL